MSQQTLDRTVAPEATEWAGLRWVVPLAVVLTVVLRLPFLHAPAGPDEAGFLQVAAQWRPGSQLYGDYWVDRPPLLITLFQVASATGGLVALRALGSVAAATSVLLAARAAGLVAGPRAARWTAVLAAVLTAAPRVDGQEVNGELLAAPFVAAGILAALVAVRAVDVRRRVVAAAGAGAAAACAVLVKQNIVDVVVFAAVLFIGSLIARRLGVRATLHLVGGAVAGALIAGALVAGWTVAHGTSLSGVYDAMYPFRVRAGAVQAAGDTASTAPRLHALLKATVSTGLTMLTAWVLLALLLRRTRDVVLLALAATLAYDAVSVLAGGAYWLHYLVEAIMPLTIAAGVLVARGMVPMRLLVAGTVALAAYADVTHHVTASPSQSLGQAIGAASQPGDTLTTLYGDASINLAAGETSPYAYLWSLPAKTLDPHLDLLDQVLTSPSAPTWIVVTSTIETWGLDTAETSALIAQRYVEVGVVCGASVYLRVGLTRPTPSAPACD